MSFTHHLPLWTSTCRRHEIHTALLKPLVQWPSGPKAEIRLYDCNLFKTVLLVIYVTNLYRKKISLFIPSKDEILVKKTTTSLHEKMTPVDSNFNFLYGRPHWAWPHLPPRPHVSTWAWPLHVDVINEWPLMWPKQPSNMAIFNILTNLAGYCWTPLKVMAGFFAYDQLDCVDHFQRKQNFCFP